MRILILLMLLVGLTGCSNDAITAAGAIAYAEKDGQRFILLADHTGLSAHRGYGAFGGGLEENETLEQGALREFHEETACHFLSQPIEISKSYVRNKKFVSFVVHVPFIDEVILNQKSETPNCEGKVYSERANWVWVEAGDFLQQIQQGDDYKTKGLVLLLWDKSIIIFKKAQEQGLL
ncbi:hypothetical protein NBRC116188_27080 [Oceaniserpentilla sp. 4NH20-0058]|uniref:NUDIX hydrolase n=1 Tax=Oceaniserpentilla sp. 4NH20-0058 TaxID=3127660 RepID=UPI00310A869E